MKRLHFTYHYKDHTSAKLSTGLGNNRLSYADSNGNGKIDTPGSTAVTIWEDGFEDKSTANGDWESVGAKYGRKITGFDNSKAKSGTTSGYIKLNANGKWTDYYVHSNEWIDINITEPTLYRFSGWVYLDNLIYRGQFFFFMNKESETNYFTEVIHVETREKNKWVYMEKVVLVQPEIKKLNFRIDADSRQNGTVWYDDLKIEQLDMSQNEIVSETNYYPFGLAHKGYNEHKNSSNLGENYKFNGVEFNNDMDLGLYEMDFRQYDPTIGRFTGVDPITHYDFSPYNAFDNNPVYWADPSGADAVYNWNDGKYYDEGKEVSSDQALANYGINSNGSESSPPTKFVTESGEEIADTEDGSDNVFVVKNENIEDFVKDLKNNISKKEDNNSKKNKELGEKYGFNIDNIIEEYGFTVYNGDADFQLGYFCGRNGGIGVCLGAYTDMGDGKGGGKPAFGIEIGKRHKKQNIMNIFEPKIFDGDNFDIKVTPAGPIGRKYSDKPIPLVIE